MAARPDTSEVVSPGVLSALLEDIARDVARGPEAPTAPELRPGAVVAERYEVLREIARGGFGIVYEARDRRFDRTVALKVVRPGGRPDVREERLLREAEAAARMSNPNIVTVFDVGRCEQGPYLVLEMLQGQTLARRLQQGRLPLREALRIAVEVGKGLSHAHSKGVVHRDLTPGNVFLCVDGQVKVLDLGMAHAFGHRRVEGGTPAYMAPEQAKGAPEDERTDVFALGVILYEMLTGERPFEDERALASGRAAPALEVPGEPALGDLVARMLAQDAVKRPRDAGEILAALRTFEREVDRSAATQTARVRRSASPRRRFEALIALGALVGVGVAVIAARQLSSKTGRSPGPSVAVLPFADLSPGHDQEYFSEGLAEEIRSALARVDGLRVPGRTSSSSFGHGGKDIAGIARQLHVATLLEGSVRKEKNHVRVTAQLINATDGYRLWADTFDRELTEVLAVQEEIASRVARALSVHLQPEPAGATGLEQRRNPEAYDQYLLARNLGRRAAALQGMKDWELAEAALQKVVGMDPGFAPAWAQLASVLTVHDQPQESPERRRAARAKAFAAAERAIGLAPKASEGYSARGFLRSRLLRDWQGALADYERALELFPGDELALRRYSWLLVIQGRGAEAVAAAKRVVEIDPVSARAWANLADAHFYTRRLDLARPAIRRALEIAPEFFESLDLLALTELLEGHPSAALEVSSRMSDEYGSREFYAVATTRPGMSGDRALENWLARWGERLPYDAAELCAWRGAHDRAFEWLNRALAAEVQDLAGVGVDPLLRSLHSDPRFTAILRAMNLETH
jgi:serine/threonine protein kinase/tetratricopeptide (TPR) repeat protein